MGRAELVRINADHVYLSVAGHPKPAAVGRNEYCELARLMLDLEAGADLRLDGEMRPTAASDRLITNPTMSIGRYDSLSV